MVCKPKCRGNHSAPKRKTQTKKKDNKFEDKVKCLSAYQWPHSYYIFGAQFFQLK